MNVRHSSIRAGGTGGSLPVLSIKQSLIVLKSVRADLFFLLLCSVVLFVYVIGKIKTIYVHWCQSATLNTFFKRLKIHTYIFFTLVTGCPQVLHYTEPRLWKCIRPFRSQVQVSNGLKASANDPAFSCIVLCVTLRVFVCVRVCVRV